MSQLKVSIGVLLAAIACLFAVGTATAIASEADTELHECAKEEGTPKKRYSTSTCIPGTTTVNGEYTWKLVETPTPVPVEAVSASLFKLNTTIAGVKFGASCSFKGSGEVVNSGGAAIGSAISMTLTGCEVTEPAGKGCKVEFKVASLKGASKEMNLTYSPTSGTKFATVTVSGCSVGTLNGEKEVTGTATSVVPEMGAQQFTAESSALKLGGQPVTIVGGFEIARPAGGAILGLIT